VGPSARAASHGPPTSGLDHLEIVDLNPLGVVDEMWSDPAAVVVARAVGPLARPVGLRVGQRRVTDPLGLIGGPRPTCTEPGMSSLAAMSKKTAKRRAKARRKKANHRSKPNAR
jgi:hypothetical protein